MAKKSDGMGLGGVVALILFATIGVPVIFFLLKGLGLVLLGVAALGALWGLGWW
jgi:hypothetical protein